MTQMSRLELREDNWNAVEEEDASQAPAALSLSQAYLHESLSENEDGAAGTKELATPKAIPPRAPTGPSSGKKLIAKKRQRPAVPPFVEAPASKVRKAKQEPVEDKADDDECSQSLDECSQWQSLDDECSQSLDSLIG